MPLSPAPVPAYWDLCPRCGGRAMFGWVGERLVGECANLSDCPWLGEGAAVEPLLARWQERVDGAMDQIRAGLVAPAGTAVLVRPGERNVVVQLVDTRHGRSLHRVTRVLLGDGIAPDGTVYSCLLTDLQEVVNKLAEELRLKVACPPEHWPKVRALYQAAQDAQAMELVRALRSEDDAV